MSTKIFVNLPVKDLERSKAFYANLGWKINQQFTDDTASCVVISEEIYAMLLTHDKFKQFTKKQIADASKTAQVLISLSQDSKEAVHKLVDTALKNGATEPHPLEDHGFMISRAFEDFDGHGWGVFYMDPSYVQK